MKRSILSITLLGILAFGFLDGGLSFGTEAVKPSAKLPAKTVRVKSSAPPLAMEKKQFPQGMLYVLNVPAHSRFQVRPAISSALAAVDSPIWQSMIPDKKPIFIVNGGFFDPNNSLTTSFVSQKGSLVGDPRLNPQLVNNPKLIPYLPKIFNRPEFRSYLCQTKNARVETRYDIALHSEPVPDKCLLQSALGAGPSLLPSLDDYEEGFVDYNAQHKLTRDPIGVCTRNARSVVGLTDKGDVILMMGAQLPGSPKSSGFSLPEMASLLKARGAQKAMALDGGSSSSLFYDSRAIYGRVGKESGWVRRPVKSVLIVLPQ